MPIMLPFVYSLLRAVLPPWGDTLVDIAEDIADDWSAVAKAARDGWQDTDEAGIADAAEASVSAASAAEIPIPGYQANDARKIGRAAAVFARWIAHAPRKVRRPRMSLRIPGRKQGHE